MISKTVKDCANKMNSFEKVTQDNILPEKKSNFSMPEFKFVIETPKEDGVFYFALLMIACGLILLGKIL